MLATWFEFVALLSRFARAPYLWVLPLVCRRESNCLRHWSEMVAAQRAPLALHIVERLRSRILRLNPRTRIPRTRRWDMQDEG